MCCYENHSAYPIHFTAVNFLSKKSFRNLIISAAETHTQTLNSEHHKFLRSIKECTGLDKTKTMIQETKIYSANGRTDECKEK
jgi:hypothetical protein